MPPAPDFVALERSVRRQAGLAAFDAWRAQFPAQSVHDDLHELLGEVGFSPALAAAAILESFADPALERSIKMDGQGSLDTKGVVAAYLARAASLRLQAGSTYARGITGARFGGSGQPSFVRNDALPTTTPDQFRPPGVGREHT